MTTSVEWPVETQLEHQLLKSNQRPRSSKIRMNIQMNRRTDITIMRLFLA